MVESRSTVSGAVRSLGFRAGGPQPGQQLAGDRVELPDVGPLVRPQPRPDRRERPRPVEQRARSAGPEHGNVVDAVPAGEHDPITVSAFAPPFVPWLATCSRDSISPPRSIRCASTAAGSSPALSTRFVSSKLTDTPLSS